MQLFPPFLPRFSMKSSQLHPIAIQKWSNGLLRQKCAGLKATIWNQDGYAIAAATAWAKRTSWKEKNCSSCFDCYAEICRNMQNTRALNAPCRILLTNSFTSLTCSRLWRLDRPLVSSQMLPQNFPTTLHSLDSTLHQHFKPRTNLPSTQSVLRSLRSTFFPRLTPTLSTASICIPNAKQIQNSKTTWDYIRLHETPGFWSALSSCRPERLSYIILHPPNRTVHIQCKTGKTGGVAE